MLSAVSKKTCFDGIIKPDISRTKAACIRSGVKLYAGKKNKFYFV